ncbi:pectate lyase [Clostridium sp. SHJSY1]|uniref:right-handed parallel beta-helix repeat-containing protein n=1 Tax=Clostridium sp. SHJSY1 TaxID=2942483 RepID=UPI002875B237|nr:pectate lyase [Clostridium sp. SHJSY1]MDS0528557.1 pectate lyase [Clostridium sp. SHJSY1]
MNNFVKKLLFASTVFGISCLASTNAYAKDYYMSPIGSDSNAGTQAAPFASLSKAQSSATSGDIVYILGGTYKNFNIAATDANYNYVHEINKSGITYRAFSSKSRPVFDFSNVPTDKRVAAFHIAKGTSNVTFLAIDVTGVKVGSQKQSECFRIEGNATFNQVSAHDNEANGFYFVNHGTGSCIKCDAYNNIGPTSTSIGNTDGFGAHGDGVTFQYCRSWHNSDDGYDCLTSNGPNTFDHCWAYNMTAGGDSNGFKIGGYGTGTVPSSVPVHTVKYCLSANNNAHGFYANHQPGQSATWTNNTAYNNKHGNFNMLERVSQTDATYIPGTREIVHKNIAFTGTIIEESNLPSKNVSNNSWNKSGVSVTSGDFQSIDASQMTAARGADGVLPEITFMHLSNGSDLTGLGCF